MGDYTLIGVIHVTPKPHQWLMKRLNTTTRIQIMQSGVLHVLNAFAPCPIDNLNRAQNIPLLPLLGVGELLTGATGCADLSVSVSYWALRCVCLFYCFLFLFLFNHLSLLPPLTVAAGAGALMIPLWRRSCLWTRCFPGFCTALPISVGCSMDPGPCSAMTWT